MRDSLLTNKVGLNGTAHKLDERLLPVIEPGAYQALWNEFHVADARNLRQILGSSPVVDLTVTSPPYWDIKNYGTSDQIGYRQSLDSYLNDLVSVFTDVWKCTKSDGSLWIIMHSVKKDGHLHLLPFLLSQRLENLASHSWQLQDVLIWYKSHTLPWTHRQKLTDNYEHILCFSKSKSFSLNLDAIRSPEGITNWWVKYPERYHPRGKALSNVWEIAIPIQGSWGNKQFAHSCPLPVELIRRIILLGSKPNDVVLDPFAGTGTTALAANNLGRRWLAIDVNEEYRDMFYKRLEKEATNKATKSHKTESRIAQTNLALRQLKYGVLIYKRVAPSLRLTARDVPLILITSGKSQKSAQPYWVKGGRIQVVLSDECYPRIASHVASEIELHRSKPPLSKFQLEIEVEVVSKSQFLQTDHFTKYTTLQIYPRGEFWKSGGKVKAAELSAIEPLGKLPTLLSDLRVQEEPAY